MTYEVSWTRWGTHGGQEPLIVRAQGFEINDGVYEFTALVEGVLVRKLSVRESDVSMVRRLDEGEERIALS